MTLRDELSDWTDWDQAAFAVACELGIFEPDDWLSVKGFFWSDNRLGRGLDDALLALTAAGVLEFRQEPERQFRWVFERDSIAES